MYFTVVIQLGLENLTTDVAVDFDLQEKTVSHFPPAAAVLSNV